MLQIERRLGVWGLAGLVALVLGLLFGWLVIGWQLWPVEWTGVTAVDLGEAGRAQYLDLVAESYVLNKDIGLAQERLAGFPLDEQPALLEDVQTRVAHRLEQTQNILLLGNDQRPGWEIWRNDTIMVVAIDAEREQAGIISIPRDLYVDIPGYGKERINVVDYIGEKMKYPGGGPALTARVISETLGIPSEHYVRVQMDGLDRLVDALGGVTVTLECPLYERIPSKTAPSGYTEWNLPAGPVYLNGADARKFATFRYMTTDFGRTQRQQQLIWAIRNRALQGNVISRIPELWQSMSGLFSTDLGLVDVVRLANFGIGLKASNVHGLVFSRSVVKDFVTEDGAMVLLIGDRNLLETEKERLFLQKPLAPRVAGESGESIVCPPPPKP
jgi:LCP family protein required for cell wall assembly